MATDYWNMKMSGSMVMFNGKPRYIDHVTVDEEDYERTRNQRYPEDWLDVIQFVTDEDERLNYDEFEIIFPDDQFYIDHRGNLQFAQRRIARQQYKLAPNNDSYFYMSSSGNIRDLLKWDRQPDYKPLEQVFLWDREPKVFSKELGIKFSTRQRADIFYKNDCIYHLRKRTDHLMLEESGVTVPTYIKELFAEYLNEKIPYITTTSEPEEPEPEEEASLDSGLLFRYVDIRNGNIPRDRDQRVFVYAPADTATGARPQVWVSELGTRDYSSIFRVADLDGWLNDQRINRYEYQELTEQYLSLFHTGELMP